MSRLLSLLTAGLLATALAGCETAGEAVLEQQAENPTTATIQEPVDVKYFPSDEPLRLGAEHFNRGNYGLAERYYRDATEKAPGDASTWIGLAASYDRIGRFDLADRAYRQAIVLRGETTQILNNLGYSYMLRGNLAAARAKFMEAYRREPNNPTVINNLQLLKSSSSLVRSPR